MISKHDKQFMTCFLEVYARRYLKLYNGKCYFLKPIITSQVINSIPAIDHGNSKVASSMAHSAFGSANLQRGIIELGSYGPGCHTFITNSDSKVHSKNFDKENRKAGMLYKLHRCLLECLISK